MLFPQWNSISQQSRGSKKIIISWYEIPNMNSRSDENFDKIARIAKTKARRRKNATAEKWELVIWCHTLSHADTHTSLHVTVNKTNTHCQHSAHDTQKLTLHALNETFKWCSVQYTARTHTSIHPFIRTHFCSHKFAAFHFNCVFASIVNPGRSSDR